MPTSITPHARLAQLVHLRPQLCLEALVRQRQRRRPAHRGHQLRVVGAIGVVHDRGAPVAVQLHVRHLVAASRLGQLHVRAAGIHVALRARQRIGQQQVGVADGAGEGVAKLAGTAGLGQPGEQRAQRPAAIQADTREAGEDQVGNEPERREREHDHGLVRRPLQAQQLAEQAQGQQEQQPEPGDLHLAHRSRLEAAGAEAAREDADRLAQEVQPHERDQHQRDLRHQRGVCHEQHVVRAVVAAEVRRAWRTG